MGMPHTFQPRWKFWMARLFGRHVIGADWIKDNEAVVTEGYEWRGRIYITKYHHVVDYYKGV